MTFHTSHNCVTTPDIPSSREVFLGHDLIGTQQIWGAALIGIGWVAWNLRGTEGNQALISIAKAFIVVAALPFVITLFHFTQGFSGPSIYMNILVNGLAMIALFMKAK